MQKARHRSGTWLRPRVVAAFAVAGAGLAAAFWLPTRNDVAAAAEQPTAFADEFTGERGAALDRDKWTLPGRGRGASLDGKGNLVISRLLVSKIAFGQAYGHAEARIEVKRAPGVWRAFTVLDPSGKLLSGKFDVLDASVDPTSGDDFHTYAIDWSPESIVWSVDGRPSLRLTPEVAARPLFVFLNVATDGRSPARMLVDFVRVTTSDGPTPTSPAPSTTSPAPTSPAPSSPAPTTPSPTATVAPTTAAPTPTKTVAPAPAPAWKAFTKYAAGDLVRYKGVTYKVKEAHTSLPGWEPTALPELFEKV